jgi:hypothetical protein
MIFQVDNIFQLINLENNKQRNKLNKQLSIYILS